MCEQARVHTHAPHSMPGHRNTNQFVPSGFLVSSSTATSRPRSTTSQGHLQQGAGAEKVLPTCRTSTLSGGVPSFSLSGTPTTKSALKSLMAALAAFHSLHNIKYLFFPCCMVVCREKHPLLLTDEKKNVLSEKHFKRLVENKVCTAEMGEETVGAMLHSGHATTEATGKRR